MTTHEEALAKFQKRHRVVVGVYLVLIQDGQLLMYFRHNSGYMNNLYSLVSGHLDGDESAISGMIREAREEAGIDISPEDLTQICTMHRYQETGETFDLFMLCEKYKGEIKNLEPEKCKELKFFSVDSLPENTIDYVKVGIDNLLKNNSFCEYGWNKN